MAANKGHSTVFERFVTTCWTNVAKAQARDPGISREALGRLIELYWKPVYYFIRQKGRSRDDAADFTQQFFAEFLSKHVVSYANRSRGRFRTFLLSCVTRFLVDCHRKSARLPVQLPILEGADPDEHRLFEPADGETPEQAFDRNWARTLVGNCLSRLRQECREGGREVHYEVFRARFLPDGEPPDRRTLAASLGITEVDVDNHLRAAKERYRRILREEVGGTVRTSDEVDEELRILMSCLPERPPEPPLVSQ
jgi:RNA polymerase sigma-70 factor (ECF subfamily)